MLLNQEVPLSIRPVGGSRISGKGFICIKVLGFALMIFSQFSKISLENEIIWSLRPNYFISKDI